MTGSVTARLRPVALLLAASLALGACGQLGGKDDKGRGTVEATTARDEIDALLNDTFTAITPALTWHDEPFELAVKQEWNGKDSIAATAKKRRLVLTRLSTEKVGSLFGVVERHWKQRGYTTEAVNPKDPSMSVRTSKGYLLELVVSTENTATVTASVKDVKFDGEVHPFGKGEPLPTGTGGADLPNYGLPLVDDPFWSK
ncbi:hypothetical protein ACWGB8_23825 [Kitasatospora sp. NPDC054939]